jgi:hypothetical protein
VLKAPVAGFKRQSSQTGKTIGNAKAGGRCLTQQTRQQFALAFKRILCKNRRARISAAARSGREMSDERRNETPY